MDRDSREKCLLRKMQAGVASFAFVAFSGVSNAEDAFSANWNSDLQSKLGGWVVSEFDAAASDAEAIEKPENLNEVLGKAIKSRSWEEWEDLKTADSSVLFGDTTGMHIASWNSSEKKCELLAALGIEEPFDVSDWDIIRDFELEECVVVRDKNGMLVANFSSDIEAMSTPTNPDAAPE